MALQALSKNDTLRNDHRHAGLLGWEVRSRRDDRRLGRVDDVLVDDRGHTRYLDLNLEHRDGHVLLPSGQAEADGERDVLWTDGLGRESFDGLPAYRHDASVVDAAYERELMSAYDRSWGEERYYERPEYRSRHWTGPGEETQETARRTPGSDDAGATTATSTPVRVDELDHVKVASGDPDPRGWDVVGHDGSRLGRVEHLLADGSEMSVRYLEVSADRSLSDRDDHRFLVPVGHVDLDDQDHRVRVDALDSERLSSLPRYEEGRLDRDHERKLHRIFDSGYATERRHRHPRFRDDRLAASSEGPMAERRAAGMATGSSATAGAASKGRTTGDAGAVPGRDPEAVHESRESHRREERGSSTRQS